jgi:glutamate--cysteine ligase
METFTPVPGRKELVGIEVENGLVCDLTGESVPYRGKNGAAAFLGALVTELNGEPLFVGPHIIGMELPSGARFTLETGGALEYMSLPYVSLADAINETRRDLLQAAAIASGLDMAILSGACLPFTRPQRIPWIPKPRVEIMRKYFRRLGEAGMYADAVMGITLSTQTSLDYLSERDLAEKVRLHILASPIIAALFVNSPIAAFGHYGMQSLRMHYWTRFDPRRCGVLGFMLRDGADLDNLIDWAAGLPMIYREVKDRHVAAPDRPFADLMRNGFGDGTWPTLADWELHLCQVWPHVRVRHTLELRASDGLPWPYFAASPAVWVGLSYDREARQAASALLSDLTPRQLEGAVDEIAMKGLEAAVGPYPVRELARELLRLSRKGLMARVASGIEPAQILTFLDPLDEVCASGVTFANKCLACWSGPLDRSPEAYVAHYRLPPHGTP